MADIKKPFLFVVEIAAAAVITFLVFEWMKGKNENTFGFFPNF